MRWMQLIVVLLLGACSRAPIYTELEHDAFQHIISDEFAVRQEPLNELPSIEFWYRVLDQDYSDALRAYSGYENLSLREAEDAAGFIWTVNQWRRNCPMQSPAGWGAICDLSAREDVLIQLSSIEHHPLSTSLLRYAGRIMAIETNRDTFVSAVSEHDFAAEILADVAYHSLDSDFLREVFDRPDMTTGIARWYLSRRAPTFFIDAEWRLALYVASQSDDLELARSASLSLELVGIEFALWLEEVDFAIERFESLDPEVEPLFVMFPDENGIFVGEPSERLLEIYTGIAGVYLDRDDMPSARHAFAEALDVVSRRPRSRIEDRESFEQHRLCHLEYYQAIFDDLVRPSRTASEYFDAMTTGMPNLRNCRRDNYGQHSLRWPASSLFRSPAISRRFAETLEAAGVRLHISPAIPNCIPFFRPSARRAAQAYYRQLNMDILSEIIVPDCPARIEAMTIMEAAAAIPETSALLSWLTDAIQSNDDNNFLFDMETSRSPELLLLYQNPATDVWLASVRSSSGTSLLLIEPDADGRNSVALIDFRPYF